ncbi:MAG: energy transducer TonB [Crocinitomicaceae bacterium]|nr:energy transducer TonB [Crocinitomicaceae bacterium]
MRTLLLLLFGLSITTCLSQEEERIYDFSDTAPEFIGGEPAMMTYIQEHIEYPETAITFGEQGIVYVQFIVMKTGAIREVKIMKGVSESLDAEAVRVIRLMPNWAPGKDKNGEAVNVRYTLPIHFRLDNKTSKKGEKNKKKSKN